VVGLMRQTTDDAWHVYARGNSFTLEPNGSCAVEGRSQPCMWYGIEFDYSPSSARTRLVCTERFSKQTDVVSPDRSDTSKSETASYEVRLKGDGHVALPSAVFREPNDSPAPWKADVVCSHEGRELLRYTFTALHES